MRALIAVIAAAAIVAGSAFAAEHALRQRPRAAMKPRLAHQNRPLFDLRALERGDKAARCLRFRNAGPAPVWLFLSGRGRDGGLARHLRLRVSRGCGKKGRRLWLGRMNRLRVVKDRRRLARDRRRGYRLAVSVVGEPRPGARLVQSFTVTAVTAARRWRQYAPSRRRSPTASRWRRTLGTSARAPT